MDGNNILKMFQLGDFDRSYESPGCEVRWSMHLANFFKDIRDGIRLCKVACIVSDDPNLFQYVKGHAKRGRKAKVREMQRFNVEMTMRRMVKYDTRNLAQRFQWA